MEGEWRNATWTEFAKFPLENLYLINEEIVCKGMGYSVAELTTLAICAVPFGGLGELGRSQCHRSSREFCESRRLKEPTMCLDIHASEP
jgi:hypothetical protein